MIAGTTPAVIAALAAISLLAGLAKGLTGFGGALVMAPLFGLFVPPQHAALLIVLVHAVTALQGVRGWHAQVCWSRVLPLALLALLSAQIMTAWAAHTDIGQMRRIVGVCVLLATLLHLSGWRWRHGGRWSSTLLAGLVSGAMTALGGLGGPAAVCYFSGFAREAALRANLLGYFALLFGGVTMLLVADRQVQEPQLVVTAMLVPAFAAGVVVGERISPCLPPRVFDRLVSALLLASGLLALLV